MVKGGAAFHPANGTECLERICYNGFRNNRGPDSAWYIPLERISGLTTRRRELPNGIALVASKTIMTQWRRSHDGYNITVSMIADCPRAGSCTAFGGSHARRSCHLPLWMVASKTSVRHPCRRQAPILTGDQLCVINNYACGSGLFWRDRRLITLTASL